MCKRAGLVCGGIRLLNKSINLSVKGLPYFHIRRQFQKRKSIHPIFFSVVLIYV